MYLNNRWYIVWKIPLKTIKTLPIFIFFAIRNSQRVDIFFLDDSQLLVTDLSEDQSVISDDGLRVSPLLFRPLM